MVETIARRKDVSLGCKLITRKGFVCCAQRPFKVATDRKAKAFLDLSKSNSIAAKLHCT